MNILVLLTDAFGGFGGISRFNQDLLKAMAEVTIVDKVRVLPRIIVEPITYRLPEAIVYDRRSANSKFRYLVRAFLMLMSRAPIDLVVCAHINLLLIAWPIAKLRGAPLVLLIYGIEAWQPNHNALTNYFARRVCQVVSISRYTARRYAEWSDSDPELCTILPCCVDAAHFTPGPRNPALIKRYGVDQGPILLTVGRLASEERYKGFDEVLNVLPNLLKKFPNLRYIIAGYGPDALRLKARVKTLGISDHVVFAGKIEEEEKIDHYRLADIFVMPSSGEGFGIVLIEAAACGVPVIGSKIDGSAEALLSGRIGTLIDPRQPAELIAAITSILESSDVELRQPSPLIETFSISQFRVRVRTWLQHLARQLP